MKKIVFSRQLTQRIQLWHCRQEETDEGDLVEVWTPSITVWGKIRPHKRSNLPTREKEEVEATIRTVPYRFHGFRWGKKYYRLTSSPFRDPDLLTWQFFAKNVRDFN